MFPFAITNMKSARHLNDCSVRMLFVSCAFPGEWTRDLAEHCEMVKCETTIRNAHEHSYCCRAVMASLFARRPQPELDNLFEFNDSANY